MKKYFVPPDFKIPEALETDKFRLRMLTIKDVEKDYDAVITSIDHLRGVFGDRERNKKWPPGDLTLEQDLIDLGWHQKEFQSRSSFAYTVMNLDETQCLGCVYIFPSNNEDFDAEIYMWVRKSELEKGLDPILFKTIKEWIQEKWPFGRVSYPGRIGQLKSGSTETGQRGGPK